MRQALRVAALFLLGTLLAQTAWILAVPPYRGSDEFDHVYRAGSVASGYWRPDWRHPADGRGDLIPTPRGLVEDGSAVCSSYDYVGPDNCRPVESLDGGLVTVASAAARYNPAFYWLIGKPAMVTDGVTALYVMRFMSAADLRDPHLDGRLHSRSLGSNSVALSRSVVGDDAGPALQHRDAGAQWRGDDRCALYVVRRSRAGDGSAAGHERACCSSSPQPARSYSRLSGAWDRFGLSWRWLRHSWQSVPGV